MPIKIINIAKSYFSKINAYVFFMITFFTIGAWLDINGLWCELPVMVSYCFFFKLNKLKF
jgi:hypothetical protein